MPDLHAALSEAQRLMDGGRLQEAQSALEDASADFPFSAWPQLRLARIAQLRADAEESREHVKDALLIEADPNVYAKAAQLLMDGNDAFADDVLREGLTYYPEHAELQRLARQRQQAEDVRTAHPVVAVFGNCHADSLVMLLRCVPFLAQRFSFAVVPTQAPPGEVPRLPAELDRTVLLWEQVQTDRDTQAIRERIVGRIPAACRIVKFPPIGMLSSWPFAFSNRFNAPEPGFPWGRFPLGDRIANELIAQNVPAEEAYERYMERSRAKMPDPLRLLERDRKLLEDGDAECDVKIAPYILENFRTLPLFWSFRHPSNRMIAELAARLCAASADVFGAAPEFLRAEVEAAVEQIEDTSPMQLPVHPDVIERLNISRLTPRSTYDWFGNAWSFEEYITRYIMRDRSWSAKQTA